MLQGGDGRLGPLRPAPSRGPGPVRFCAAARAGPDSAGSGADVILPAARGRTCRRDGLPLLRNDPTVDWDGRSFHEAERSFAIRTSTASPAKIRVGRMRERGLTSRIRNRPEAACETVQFGLESLG